MSTTLEFVHDLATKALRTLGRHIPYSAQRPVLSMVLNEAFRAPLQHGELDFLEHRKIRVKVRDLGIDWLVSVGAERFKAIDRRLDADVSISGNSPDFALLVTRQADPDALFFQRRIRIEGDTELGLGLKNTMDSMDWEDLPMPLRKFLQALGVVIEKLSS